MNQTNIFKIKLSGNILFLLSLFFILVLTLPALALAKPVIFYTDILSGPNTGGENNNGTYLSIFGKGFGQSSGLGTTTKIYINNTEVASYKYLGSSNGRSDIQQLSIQPGSNLTTGSIKVVVSGEESNTDHNFIVRSGDIYFVALNGSDSTGEIGNINSPFKNVQNTFDRSDFGAGDTIIVRGGAWTNSLVWARYKGGTEANPIAVLGYPGETITVTSTGNNELLQTSQPYIVYAGFHIDENLGAETPVNIRGGSNFVRIINNEIQGMRGDPGTGAIHAVGNPGSDNKYIGNHIHNIGSTRREHGIYVNHQRNTEVAFNEIHDNGYLTGTDGGNCIQFRAVQGYDYRNQNSLIHDNLLYDCQRGGILISEGSGDGAKIYNNIFYHNGYSDYEKDYTQAAIRITPDDVNKVSTISIEIYNNIIYDSDSVRKNGGAIWLNSSIDTMTYRNNIVYALSDENYYRGSATTTVSSNNIWYGSTVQSPPSWDTNPIEADPQFVNLQNRDFHLQSNSPAIDTGVNTGITQDYDGNLRPMDGDKNGTAEYDIGAYEYTGTYIPPQDTTPPITTASPSGGTYTSSQSITLTANETATTYYTTDGTTPTTSSNTYSSPISITQNTTLKFFSVDTSGNIESVKTEIYITDTTDSTPPAPPTSLSIIP